MDQLSQSQYKIIEDYQNRLSECSKQQPKAIQIRQAHHYEQQIDENGSESCTPEKVLVPIMLKSNLKQQQISLGQNIQTQNEVQNGYRIPVTDYFQGKTKTTVQQQVQIQKTQQVNDQANSKNQIQFKQIPSQHTMSNVQTEEQVEQEVYENSQQSNEYQDQYMEDNNIIDEKLNEGESEEKNELSIPSSQRKELYVVWQLNQKRNKQYSLMEDQLQQVLENEEPAIQKQTESTDHQQYSFEQKQHKKQQQQSIQNINIEELLQADKQAQYQSYVNNQLKKKSRAQSLDKFYQNPERNEIINRQNNSYQNKQVAFQEIQLDENEDKENEQINSNMIYQGNNNYNEQFKDYDNSNHYVEPYNLKSTSQFGEQNHIRSNRIGRAFSQSSNTFDQQINNQLQNQNNYHSNREQNIMNKQSNHHVSFGQTLNVDQNQRSLQGNYFQERQVERGNSQRSRLQITSIKDIERILTNQDHFEEQNVKNVQEAQPILKQSPTTKRVNSSRNKQQVASTTARSSQIKQLPPKSLSTKNTKKSRVDKVIKDIKNKGVTQTMLISIIAEHMIECDSFLTSFEQKLKSKLNI